MTDEQMEEILDALEVVILNVKENNEIEFNVLNAKIDDVNKKFDKLIEVLNKVI